MSQNFLKFYIDKSKVLLFGPADISSFGSYVDVLPNNVEQSARNLGMIYDASHRYVLSTYNKLDMRLYFPD